MKVFIFVAVQLVFIKDVSAELLLKLSVAGSINIWADTVSVAESDKLEPITVSLPSNTNILAFQANNSDGAAGVLASLSNGMVTNDEWRCTATPPGDSAWQDKAFDDSGWEFVSTYGVNGVAPWGIIPYIPTRAQWIWTADNEVEGNVYCRIMLAFEVLATCDGRMWLYADGVDYTDANAPNAEWRVSKKYTLPRNTHVIGIQCHGNGGMSGILASVNDGPVTDMENWKCNYVPVEGWSTPGYNDSSWEMATRIADHGDSPWGIIQNPYPISINAKWIWTSNMPDHPTAWCRVRLTKE